MGDTEVAIFGEKFYINGEPTYAGRNWNGYEVEGLLLNNRQVQATFDDENADTRRMWAYPDTGEWDADRNTLVGCYKNRLDNNYRDGYQSTPVNWGLSTDLKVQFHKLAKEVSGY